MNRVKKIILNCKQCGKEIFLREKELKYGVGKYCSRTCKDKYQIGKPVLPHVREALLKSAKNQQITLEMRRKRSQSLSGKNHYNWKGGITDEIHRLRRGVEHRIWREAVMRRDNYQCVNCDCNDSRQLQTDHIKPFVYYPNLRFEVTNGRTLCIDCHKQTETYGRRMQI